MSGNNPKDVPQCSSEASYVHKEKTMATEPLTLAVDVCRSSQEDDSCAPLPTPSLAEQRNDLEVTDIPIAEQIALKLQPYRVSVSPKNKALLAWIKNGLTCDEAVEAAQCSIATLKQRKSIPFAYVDKVIASKRKDKAADYGFDPADIAALYEEVEGAENPLAEAIVREFQQYGLVVSSKNRALLAWIDKGLTMDEAIVAVKRTVGALGKCENIPFKYVHKVIITKRKIALRRSKSLTKSSGDKAAAEP